MKDYIELNNGQKWKFNTAYEGDCLDFMRLLPDKSVGLIMADPPYFEVKGEFDFIWDSFEDYLKDVEKWAIECKRILADNGSLFWWGHAKKIAYSQVIFDKYFKLENVVTWNVTDRVAMKGVEKYNSFSPSSEKCLFYSNSKYNQIGKYIKDEIEKSGIKIRDISNEFLSKTGGITGTVSNFINGYYMPSNEQYLILQKKLGREFLTLPYESISRPFDNIFRLSDVIAHSQESNISREYNHETIKPIGLIKKLIQITTRKDTIVFSPFLGSWTDAVVCYELGLKWFGCESNHQHFIDGLERYETECLQGMLEF